MLAAGWLAPWREDCHAALSWPRGRQRARSSKRGIRTSTEVARTLGREARVENVATCVSVTSRAAREVVALRCADLVVGRATGAWLNVAGRIRYRVSLMCRVPGMVSGRRRLGWSRSRSVTDTACTVFSAHAKKCHVTRLNVSSPNPAPRAGRLHLLLAHTIRRIDEAPSVAMLVD